MFCRIREALEVAVTAQDGSVCARFDRFTEMALAVVI